MSEHEKQEMSEQAPNDYCYQWNYGAQCAYENERAKQKKRSGALVYALVMTAVFAVCLALLIGVLVWYDVDVEQNMTVAEVSEAVSPATVLIYATGTSSYGYGTGFFIRSNGYIATNYHVVQDKTEISVTLYSGQVLGAKLIDYSVPDDLAVLKVEGSGFPTVSVGNSDALRVGELAIAIGNPSGTDAAWTTTQGIISALNREVTVTGTGTIEELTMIQTDAPVNPGNSGGPLCNARGEVIGIVTRKLSDYEGIGFAIPINGAMEILNTIVDTGSASGIQSSISKVRPTIGIGVSDIQKGDAYYDAKGYKHTAEKSGVFISTVDEKGAANGLLQPGDIIIEADGEPIKNQEELRKILYGHKVGDRLRITVWRNGEAVTVTVTLGKS